MAARWVSSDLSLVQTGMSRNNRISWMGREINRYEGRGKQSQCKQWGGRDSLYCSYSTVSVDVKQLQFERRQEGGWRQRFRKAMGEGGNSNFWLMGWG